MVDVWLDAVTPKDSLLIHSLLPLLQKKGYNTIVTAKKQTQTTDILELLNVNYTCVGNYGETLKEKLKAEQNRTLQLIDLFDEIGLPKVLWTHGDVSAIRTAFGLQIPIVYSNDTLHAIHVAKLVCPLVNCLVAPLSFGKSWSKFGISKSKIMLYDGVEEIAWLLEPKFEYPNFLKELTEKEPVILFRNVEYKASYFKDVKVDVNRLVKKLTEIATIVYLPRYEEEKEELKKIDNIWVPPEPVLAAQLIPYVSVAVGSGGTICRETALMGIPTINFHFWDVIAKDLETRGFPIQYSTDLSEILRSVKEILRKPERHTTNTAKIMRKLESPTSKTIRLIEKYGKLE